MRERWRGMERDSRTGEEKRRWEWTNDKCGPGWDGYCVVLLCAIPRMSMCVACVYLIQTKDVFEERLQNHHHYHPPPRRCLLATEPKMNSRIDSQHAQQKKEPNG
ncbi:hypothetical protein VTJ04DRAFT_2975 [Mycothermus thermophilus]|uniref:uncharacterized protein n=1 Tax=Humicola insolens TaxID=85995 RepID=UPI003742A320